MKTVKIVVLVVLGTIVFAGYVAGASYMAGLLQQQTPADDLSFGAMIIRSANGDRDADGVSVFDTLDKRLLFDEQAESGQLKLFALYYAYAEPEEAFPAVPETVALNIDKNHAKDLSLTVLKVTGDNAPVVVPASVELRTQTDEKGEESSSFVLLFAVDEPGYYGLAAQRTQAQHAGRVVFVSLAAATMLYALLFFVLKPRARNAR